MRQLTADRIPATLAWLGTFGALLTAAGLDYPGRTPFTLLFLMVTPAVCFAQLLPGIDPLARAVISIAAGVTLVAVVAEVMLAADWWTPRGGLIAVGALCAGLLGLALALARRPGATAAPASSLSVAGAISAQVSPDARDDAAQDDDAWIYEE
jgi:hypothetical protein